MARAKSAVTCLFLVAGGAEHDGEPGTPPLGDGRASQEPGGSASRENGKVLLEVEGVEVGVDGKASLEQPCMVELEVVGQGGRASLEDEDCRRGHVCDGEAH